MIVVEAREKSGTLITVDMALEQGREVFAVPGRITDSLSRGCNQLFRQGAGVAVSPVDILEALYGIEGYNNIEETGMKNPKSESGKKKVSKLCMLSPQEKQVYQYLEVLPKTAEELWKQMGRVLTIQEVMSILVELCIKGFAGQTAEGYCQKVLAT